MRFWRELQLRSTSLYNEVKDYIEHYEESEKVGYLKIRKTRNVCVFLMHSLATAPHCVVSPTTSSLHSSKCFT